MTVDIAAASAVTRDLADWGEELTGCAPLPGGVIAVSATTGSPTVSVFGRADLRTGAPMRPDHLFQIGSISKVFTSLLVNQQIDGGRLSLDTVVGDVLPWLEVADGRARQLTVERLLNHTSGLIVGADPIPDDLEQAWQLRQVVTAAPGNFHYSNVGYVLLGLLLRAVTGRTLAQLLATELFAPLGMTQSHGRIVDEDRARYATGHQPGWSGRPWVPGDPVEPAPWFETNTADGSIGATASDLSRLATLFLGHGIVDGRRVASDATISRMLERLAPQGEAVPQIPGVTPVRSSRYGLGINVEDVAGHQVVTHGGGMVGYSTFFLADLDAGLGVVVLTNANGDASYSELLARAGHTALSELSGATRGYPRVAPDNSRWWPSVETQVLADALPAALTGTFPSDDPQLPDLTVATDPTSGFLAVELGGTRGRLFRDGHGQFLTDHRDLRDFVLHPDPAGGWSYGPTRFGGTATTAPAHDDEASWGHLVGRYRSFSPWYRTLRVFARAGRLFLATPGGVEAPGDAQELVELEPDVFRIGAREWLPERLIAGPRVDGHCVFVARDGCHYSRTFLD